MIEQRNINSITLQKVSLLLFPVLFSTRPLKELNNKNTPDMKKFRSLVKKKVYPLLNK